MKAKVGRRQLNGILLLDKPAGISSNAALQAVKRLYQAERAGHTGSLDPLATGLLPICLGQATKLSGLLLDADKVYVARARLGERTATGDAEGEVVARSDAAALDRAGLEAVRAAFTGDILQTPPMYSALKREGRPLYELARAGLEVERAARAVRIHRLELTDFGGGEFGFEVACSKGTYVRTLAEDWAAAAGQCAHLVALRRTGLAPFDAGSMVTLERLQAAAAEGSADALLLPMAAALRGWPRVSVTAAQAQRLAHGQAVEGVQPAQPAAAAALAIFAEAGDLLGIGEFDAAGRLAPKRWLSQ
ncbi:MAG: tRNA pseudouridine(55) synthase TruB [Nevskia sp.]|nr:tRNA pseudouridine(55) synthase TruB [Nevskia sp.]